MNLMHTLSLISPSAYYYTHQKKHTQRQRERERETERETETETETERQRDRDREALHLSLNVTWSSYICLYAVVPYLLLSPRTVLSDHVTSGCQA